MFQSPRNCSKASTPNLDAAGTRTGTCFEKNQRIKTKNGKNKAGTGHKSAGKDSSHLVICYECGRVQKPGTVTCTYCGKTTLPAAQKPVSQYKWPPSNPASTVQTQPCTCRVLSNRKSPQYALSSECLPPTPPPRPSPHHPTGLEIKPSAPASVPSRTPSPLPSLPLDSSSSFPSARAATCRARESLHQSSAGCVPNLHVLTVKPAPHILVLQIRVQPLRKLSIFARITDEARKN